MKATERLEKAERSLGVSRESLTGLREKLSTMEKELGEAVLDVETGTGQKRRVEGLDREIKSLKGQILDHERTISVLESALPELRKAASIEEAQEVGVSNYREAHGRYVELIGSPPSTEGLTAFITKVRGFIEKLYQVQDSFLTAGKNLNLAILEHKLDKVADISSKKLEADRNATDRVGVRQFGDQVLLASEKLRELSANLFHVVAVEFTDLRHRIEVPPEFVEEVCPCGKHRRVYEPATELWKIFAKPGSVGAPAGATSEFRHTCTRGRENRPTFPCELND